MTNRHSSEPTAEEDVRGWVEILSLAIRVGARAAFVDNIQVSVEWGEPQSAGWRGSPGALCLALSFKAPAAHDNFATYFLAPWQHLLAHDGASPSPVPLLTVTPNVMVLGPLTGPDTHPDTVPVAEKLTRVIAAAVDLEENNQVHWRSLAGSVPEALQVEPVTVLYNYALVQGRLSGSAVPDERMLSLVAPGKMLGLTLLRESGAQKSGRVTQVWVPPAPYEPPSPEVHDTLEQRLDDVTMSRLPALHAEMTHRVQAIYRRALEQALEETSESRRRLSFFREAEAVREAIFSYPFHTGPAFAAGAGEFDLSCREFARLIALPPEAAEEKLLPSALDGPLSLGLGLDAETANLYLSDYGHSLAPHIGRLPPPTVDNLPALLVALGEYQRLAVQAPGRWGTGDLSIGEQPMQFYPSDEELLVSIVGRSIQIIVDIAARDDVRRVLVQAGVADTGVEYGAVRLREVYVGGRGNLFHADPVELTQIQLV